ncbi:hypothetical protein A1O3_08633 [Capronia epimyces CBS 606.96]|uniref:Isochorismatase-like domain-containing protein n=1 Tax=Capronia epimyces CBS 606.96 TaxID=1182542 RepID=W9XF46_9EURO|nr:uncharacterized protein A1O3_08633 [Capronia epimyces CBS 606.96]EXJ79132.1 hypothetical protein A1O3_08633 [Capronia epimyces CBS 606.96]
MPARNIRTILGIPPSTPSVSDSVLIIIDAQNEYLNGLLQVENAESSRKAIRALLERYRNAAGNIVHVVADSAPGAPIFTPGTPLSEIIDELKPKGDEPVSKEKRREKREKRRD